MTAARTSKGCYWSKPHDESAYRSGLEDLVSEQLTLNKIPFTYEELSITYVRPARKCRYKPDFVLTHNGIIVETKGRFVTADRQKMIQVKEQHSELDIRLVFSNPSTKISKKSKTTYAMWCEKNGFPYAKQLIPEAWLKEEPIPSRLKALKEFMADNGNT